mmetsp:Transcript_24376/g.73239  ORF Transcript_24376/g.73239 Transcript_24376/m.73239 type:complete len:211 (-) Transcript_24376:2374-3006(-)
MPTPRRDESPHSAHQSRLTSGCNGGHRVQPPVVGALPRGLQLLEEGVADLLQQPVLAQSLVHLAQGPLVNVTRVLVGAREAILARLLRDLRGLPGSPAQRELADQSVVRGQINGALRTLQVLECLERAIRGIVTKARPDDASDHLRVEGSPRLVRPRGVEGLEGLVQVAAQAPHCQHGRQRASRLRDLALLHEFEQLVGHMKLLAVRTPV